MLGLQIIFKHKTVFKYYLKGVMFCAASLGNAGLEHLTTVK